MSEIIYNVPNSRKSNAKINGAEIKHDEWFVYLVDNERRYYKQYKEPHELLKGHERAIFLGIGRPEQPIQKSAFTKLRPVIKKVKSIVTAGGYLRKLNKGICCYCEVALTSYDHKISTHKTKDHLIPKSLGGTILAPCCFGCNAEKANLTLPKYIQFLNTKMLEVSGTELTKLQTKIKNANKIAIELSLK
jgi:hypothetical protein